MTIGFRIFPRRRAVDAKWVAQYRDLPVANVSDMMSRATAGGARLRPLHSGGYMSGPAFTVKTRPGDNLIVHKALDLGTEGALERGAGHVGLAQRVADDGAIAADGERAAHRAHV